MPRVYAGYLLAKYFHAHPDVVVEELALMRIVKNQLKAAVTCGWMIDVPIAHTGTRIPGVVRLLKDWLYKGVIQKQYVSRKLLFCAKGSRKFLEFLIESYENNYPVLKDLEVEVNDK